MTTEDVLREENERLKNEVTALKWALRQEKRAEIPEDLIGNCSVFLQDMLYEGDSRELSETGKAVSTLAKSLYGTDTNGELLSCKEMAGNQYSGYTDMVDLLLHLLDSGIVAIKEGKLTSSEIQTDITLLGECIYDLTLQASVYLKDFQVEDSRDLYNSIFYWAKCFEEQFDDEDEEADYYISIEDYGKKKLDAYFEAAKEKAELKDFLL